MKKINFYISNLIDRTPDKPGLSIQTGPGFISYYLFTAIKKATRLFLIVIFTAFFSSPLTAAVYFVDSQNGSDTASGLSETSAWQSLTKVNTAALNPGDTVKFARGGIWRGSLKPKSGTAGNPITYTCFGSEMLPKPRLYGSLPLNDPSYWEKAGTNLWRTAAPVTKVLSGTFSDVGNLIFNGKSAGIKCWSKEQLTANDYFWFEPDTRQVWLYSTINPGEKFDEIEAALRSAHVVNLVDVNNVVVSDFDVRYGAAHGFCVSNASYITIRDCDISWIGGGVQSINSSGDPIRFGNGVEFWNSARDSIVEGCRIWEIYDAALTNQGTSKNDQRNITYRNNIIWNSEYSFEYWNKPAESVSENIIFTQNMCYNAGYGWGHSQRPDMKNGRHIMVWGNTSKSTNIVIADNIFAYASESLFWDSATSAAGTEWRKSIVSGNNIWLQHPDKLFVVEGFAGYNTPNPAITLNKPPLPYDRISVYQWQISEHGETQIDVNGKHVDIGWKTPYTDEFEKFSVNTDLYSQDLVLVQNSLPDPQIPSVGHIVPFNHTLQTDQAVNAGVRSEFTGNNDKTISSLQYLGKATAVYWTWNSLGNKEISNQSEVQVYRTVATSTVTKPVNPTEGTEIRFPVLSADGQTREGTAYIPAATFKQDIIVSVKQEMALAPGTSDITRLTHSNLGINFTAEGNTPQKTITLKMPYNSKDIENLDEDTLIIARYDTTKKVWIPIKSSVDKTGKFVTAEIDNMTIFAIMGTEKRSGLNGIKYYPNPLRPSKGVNYSRMHFTNLPEGTVIRIYTLLGQTVRKLKADGSGIALWDGKNENGDPAASGVYIAYIEDKKGNKKKIKIAMER